MDDRLRAPAPPAGRLRAGAAEPDRRVRGAAGRRDRRLRRRLAGDDRPRQPGRAVAGGRAAARGVLRARPRARAAAHGLPALPRRRLARPGVLPRALRLADSLCLAREDDWSAGRDGDGAVRRPPRRAPARHAATSSARTRSCACSPRGARSASACFARADQLRREVNGDVVTLRGHAQRPVHERLLLPLRLLRVLEGQARREPARRAVPRPARGDRPPRRRGLGARRDGDLPAGRHPPGVRRRLLRVRRPGDQGRGAGAARPCVQRARDLAGRGDARLPTSTTYLERLRDAGLASLPGPPPRCSTTRFARSSAPTRSRRRSGSTCTTPRIGSGLRSNVTIMFGHVDGPRNWARHLLAVRELQRRTGGFTEFVPLPFVHMEAPIYLRGRRAPRADLRRAAARCTPSGGSRSTRGSRTCRSRG